MTSMIVPILVAAVLAPSPAEPPASSPTSAPETDASASPTPESEPAPEGEAEGQAAPTPAAEPPPEVAPEPAATPLGEATAPAADAAPAASVAPAAPLPPSTERTRALVAPPPPPDRPIRWRLDFGLNLGTTVVQDLGYRAFAERRNLLEYGASAVFDFRLAAGRVFLGGGLAYERTRREGDAYGSQIITEVALHEPRVLGRVSFMALEGLDAFARVGVGPSIGALSLRSEQGVRQDVVLPRVDAQAGLSLYLPKAWLPRKQASRISAGLELGLGYTWRGTIDVRPALEQGDEPLRATTSPLGELSLHGVSWGLGLFVRVM